ncbi:MAG: ATP-binding protein [Prevotellaceae bacterium]|jgi:predicted ATP-dependent endonuclease of OLD family|nr:ATP-binding protein [Prevotellaceae bacterium]
MAPKIVIKNIGPIKEANLDLNKINVFMGPQSSGKSTIAKLISYCTWVEKDVATSQSLEAYQKDKNYFADCLENFHRLSGYFKHPNRYISYESDVIAVEYSAGNFSVRWKDRYAYKRSKISYIPSERNMVILPDVRKVEFGNSNIRSFLFDWFDARKSYSKTKKMSILNLGIDYYYNENSDEDHILSPSGDYYDIALSNASSGLQSITPLFIILDYLTSLFYKGKENISFVLNERRNQTDWILMEELVLKKYFDGNRKNIKDEVAEINEKLSAKDEQVGKLVAEWDKIMENLFSTHNAQFIIEEPGQNLFPETQRDLVYHLLSKCVNSEHRLTITTHSPYILYALNNCMLGGLVGDKMKNADKEKVKCKASFINPQNVSVYEIHDGALKPIQQDDGLISANYFDAEMKKLMDDFYVMLNYYGV